VSIKLHINFRSISLNR